MSVTARDIEQLLAQRHSRDVFVTSCKTGPTHYSDGLLILDAWAMKRSWSNPVTHGYEIKVSRSDFLRDEKWRGYLDYCSSFSFVCPPGIISPDELPPEVGLVVTSKNGTRLYTKRKPVDRKVEIPESLFRYVLMCRSQISRNERESNSLDYWQEWLNLKREKQETGVRVAYRIEELVRARVSEVKRENQALRDENQRLQSIKELAEILEIDLNSWNLRREMEQRCAELRGAVPAALRRSLSDLERSIGEFREALP